MWELGPVLSSTPPPVFDPPTRVRHPNRLASQVTLGRTGRPLYQERVQSATPLRARTRAESLNAFSGTRHIVNPPTEVS
jgi:hypothetical protein